MNLVTIIMATYNREHLIIESLLSIQNQTYANIECIIIDDFSNDNTAEIILNFAAQDTRFKYFLKGNKYKKGLSGSRNNGLDIAKERNAIFIQFFDDDDIMHPKKIALQLEPLLVNNRLDFSICKYRHYIKDEVLNDDLLDEPCNINSVNLFEDFYLGKMSVNSLGPLWRSTIIFNYRFNESLLFAEERDLYLRLFLKEKPQYIPIPFVLFYYRKHQMSNTKKRYSEDVKKDAILKSDISLFLFCLQNKLFSSVVLKQFIKKYFLRRSSKFRKSFNKEFKLMLLKKL